MIALVSSLVYNGPDYTAYLASLKAEREKWERITPPGHGQRSWLLDVPPLLSDKASNGR
jgi:hypothetical protein